jgi:DNA mismatch endonuclease (patch repair protein)
MQAVKSKNTGPEMVVRRMLHAMGYRFRLHDADLPGKPDLVFPRLHKVLFVHGCFWHGHGCARGSRVPKSNREYWSAKVSRNRARDKTTMDRLRAATWDALVVWECELGDLSRVAKSIRRFLGRR